MSGFEEAFAKVMAAEGINGDAFDKGGKHKYGISQRAYPDLNLDTLTKEDAKKIYKRDYWDKIKADELPANLRGTAFDAAVNQGVGFATRALAKAGGNPEDFNQLRADRYNSIVAKDPSQNRYIKGWMNRLNTYAEPGTYAPAASTPANPPVTAPAAAPANTATTPPPVASLAPVAAPVARGAVGAPIRGDAPPMAVAAPVFTPQMSTLIPDWQRGALPVGRPAPQEVPREEPFSISDMLDERQRKARESHMRWRAQQAQREQQSQAPSLNPLDQWAVTPQPQRVSSGLRWDNIEPNYFVDK